MRGATEDACSACADVMMSRAQQTTMTRATATRALWTRSEDMNPTLSYHRSGSGVTIAGGPKDAVAHGPDAPYGAV